MKPPLDLSLYLVTDSDLVGDRKLEDVVAEAIEGGVTIVQLREKRSDLEEFIEIASKLKSLLTPLNIPLIINDNVAIALAVGADGVHIGQSDMEYSKARAMLGNEAIIGLSVESLDQIEKANSMDLDYIGISPIYNTPTKSDTAPPFGLEGCRKAVELSKHKTVAIGGMNLSTIAQTIDCGVDGVAVVSAIIAAESPRKAAEELTTVIQKMRKQCNTTEF